MPADDDANGSQSTCDGVCVVGITAAIIAVLGLVSVGWLSGRLARIGCPSPLKKMIKKRAQTEPPAVEFTDPINSDKIRLQGSMPGSSEMGSDRDYSLYTL